MVKWRPQKTQTQGAALGAQGPIDRTPGRMIVTAFVLWFAGPDTALARSRRHADACALMSTQAEIYSAVKGELGALARPLFEKSEQLLRERGDFLPHAAVLAPEGRVSLLGAMCNTKDGFANSWHILPMVHDGLRSMAGERELAGRRGRRTSRCDPGARHGAAPSRYCSSTSADSRSRVLHAVRQRRRCGEFKFGKLVTLFAESEVNAWTKG